MWARRFVPTTRALPSRSKSALQLPTRHVNHHARTQRGSQNYQVPPSDDPKFGMIGAITLGFIAAQVATYVYFISRPATVNQLSEQDKSRIAATGYLAQEYANAAETPPIHGELVSQKVGGRSTSLATRSVVTHTICLPSNMPCEDFYSNKSFLGQSLEQDYAIGYTGASTTGIRARVWREASTGCLGRPWAPHDAKVRHVITEAFKAIDAEALHRLGSAVKSGGLGAGPGLIGQMAYATSGSCALYALYDQENETLKVANAGNSRAVLGRWQDDNYVARALSQNHNGFNKHEVDELHEEHPGEEVVDEETGRVFGLAVTRAFGDFRWKWPQELSRRAHELYFGPQPRPDDDVLTPPYITAEPELSETKIHTGERPDFLILASDGLWDLMSKQDAVTCVQMWLEQYKPLDHTAADVRHNTLAVAPVRPPYESMPSDTEGFEDSYYDEKDKCLEWRVSPKHFVVEDNHVGTHLIRNALGGSRTRLLETVLTLQPPHSRKVRDDIILQVVFFGVDTNHFFEEQRRKEIDKHRSPG